jgi:hypothetical protein
MRISLFRFTALPLLLCLALPMFAQEWEFAKEKDGIKVYTKKEKGNDLKTFRGVMEISSTMAKIRNLVGNVHNREWWDDDVKEVKVLYFEENRHFKYYILYDVPWPMADRDLCVDAKVTEDPVTGRRQIMATPLANLVPEKDGVVRIKNYWQKWDIQPLENGRIRLTLEGFVDPAGSVPSWLYNMVITETPIRVMGNVKSRVETK